MTPEQIAKRNRFEEIMKKVYPPELYPQLWCNCKEHK